MKYSCNNNNNNCEQTNYKQPTKEYKHYVIFRRTLLMISENVPVNSYRIYIEAKPQQKLTTTATAEASPQEGLPQVKKRNPEVCA